MNRLLKLLNSQQGLRDLLSKLGLMNPLNGDSSRRVASAFCRERVLGPGVFCTRAGRCRRGVLGARPMQGAGTVVCGSMASVSEMPWVGRVTATRPMLAPMVTQ
jgi:hypothetical protein